MEFEHEKFGKCVVLDITQKMLEDFQREIQDTPLRPASIWRGNCIRAAIKHGIMTEPKMTVEDVDNANPAYIKWLADYCVAKVVSEAMNIDPLS